jgi:hypothetical protein
MGTSEMAQLYAGCVFPHYGFLTRVDKVIFDRDPRITSNVFHVICDVLGVHKSISMACAVLMLSCETLSQELPTIKPAQIRSL